MLLEELERLSEGSGAVSRLRRFIFALAMQGRLVARGVSAGWSREEEAAPLSETPPDWLPAGWLAKPLAEIATARLGKMLDKAKNRGTPRPYLRNVNVRWFDFDLSDLRLMPFEDHELPEFVLRPGDVLICEGGEAGRAAVWDGREPEIYFQKAIHRVRLNTGVSPWFLVYYLRSAAYEGRLAPYSTGATFQHLTGQRLAALPIPIPPLAEQEAIVTRVDELMVLCDQLEIALAEREARRDALMESLLHEALTIGG
jgi:type I restriction enzyme S subunit